MLKHAIYAPWSLPTVCIGWGTISVQYIYFLLLVKLWVKLSNCLSVQKTSFLGNICLKYEFNGGWLLVYAKKGFWGSFYGFFWCNGWQSNNILSMRFRNFPVGFKILTLPLDFHSNLKRLAGICRGWVFKVGRLYIFHLDERLTHTKSRPFAFRAGL